MTAQSHVINNLPIKWREILLVEDDSSRAHRRNNAGVSRSKAPARIAVRLHRITSTRWHVVAEKTYRAGELLTTSAKQGGKAAVALKLIDGIRMRRGVVAAGSEFGSNAKFRAGLVDRNLKFVVEIRPSSKLQEYIRRTSGNTVAAAQLLRLPMWRKFNVSAPFAAAPLKYWAAQVANVMLPGGHVGRLFAAQIGRISGIHRGTIFGLTSERNVDLLSLLRVVGWARWIRPAARKQEREALSDQSAERKSTRESARRVNGARLPVRANISIARQQDTRAADNQTSSSNQTSSLRGVLTRSSRVLNVAELFAGAGGMGLGFLLACNRDQRFRLVFSGEVNPIYVQTLNTNHDVFHAVYEKNRKNGAQLSEEPVDLRTTEALKLLRRRTREFGKIDVLIGGPPCQGFSNANRNSWHSKNPHNRLVDVFLSYVEALRPRVFLLENVQGILWTPKGGRSPQLTVVEHLARRVQKAGYAVFPKLLDAVWYGVPQYRSRFFLLGLRADLGYGKSDFGEWGPFPLPSHGPGCSRPYVTVRDAIGDLPRIRNGEHVAKRAYTEPSADERQSNPFLNSMRNVAPRDVILDHVTSRHADYVIDRYRSIPRGGNWQDILNKLTNYADARRTHSNIYRRLEWDDPAVTIGHYRKSMLVHPSQHRGLSLREAARLQSFPDWFRFSGRSIVGNGGLTHQQQQLANAVCPLVTKALAEFILKL